MDRIANGAGVLRVGVVNDVTMGESTMSESKLGSVLVLLSS